MSILLHPRTPLHRSATSLVQVLVFTTAVTVCLAWGWIGWQSLRQQLAEQPRQSQPLLIVPASAGPELEYWGLVR